MFYFFTLGVKQSKDLIIANFLLPELSTSGHVLDTTRERTVETGRGKFTAFISIMLWQQVFSRQIH
jgi:hypothetical protein